MDILHNLLNPFIQPEIKIVIEILVLFLILSGLFGIISNRKILSKHLFRQIIGVYFYIVLFQTILIALNVLNIKNLILYDFSYLFSTFTFSLFALWLGWIWCFLQPEISTNGIKWILGLALTFIFSLQVLIYLFPSFDIIGINPYLSVLWFLITFIIFIVCLIIIIFNHRNGWLGGSILFILHIIGLTASRELALQQTEQIAVLQITQLISYIFLPFIIQELNLKEISSEGIEPVSTISIANKNFPILMDDEILKSWLSLVINDHPALLLDQFIESMKITFHAERVDIIYSSPGYEKFSIYKKDSIRKEKYLLTQESKKLKNMENANALKRKKPFFYNKNDYIPNDLIVFLKNLRIPYPVNLFFFPINSGKLSPSNYGLLFSSSTFQWSKIDLGYLRKINDELALILEKIFPGKVANIASIPAISYPEKAKEDILSRTKADELPEQTIQRLQLELQLTLEEYARVKNLLEEKGIGRNLWEKSDRFNN